jgi:hypothetical protein
MSLKVLGQSEPEVLLGHNDPSVKAACLKFPLKGLLACCPWSPRFAPLVPIKFLLADFENRKPFLVFFVQQMTELSGIVELF